MAGSAPFADDIPPGLPRTDIERFRFPAATTSYISLPVATRRRVRSLCQPRLLLFTTGTLLQRGATLRGDADARATTEARSVILHHGVVEG